MDGVGLPEALLDAANFAMDIDIDVATGRDTTFVQNRCAGLHRLLRIKHRWQWLIVDLQQPARFFRGTLGFGDDGRDPLANEADDIVEDVGVVRVHKVIFMGCR